MERWSCTADGGDLTLVGFGGSNGEKGIVGGVVTNGPDCEREASCGGEMAFGPAACGIMLEGFFEK